MEDFENPFGITSPRRNRKNKKPKTKSFGYQVLGFGAGGVPAEFIVATGGNAVTAFADDDLINHLSNSYTQINVISLLTNNLL